MFGGFGTDDTTEHDVESRWHKVRGFGVHSRWSRAAHRFAAPNVVLVHGLVVASRQTAPLIRHLGPQFPVASPDLPGFGRSDKPRQVLTIPDLADALAEWMDQAGIGSAVLIGNSLGCQIAVECALRHPDRVMALVLQGPTPDPSRRSPAKIIAMNFWNGWREASTGIGDAIDRLQTGPWRAVRTALNMLADPIEDKLPKVQVPTMVIRGAKDPVVTMAWAQKVTRLLPKGILRVVPGAAHTMVAVAALEITRIVTPFIRNVADAAKTR